MTSNEVYIQFSSHILHTQDKHGTVQICWDCFCIKIAPILML